jgi:hypothetical protein
MVATAGFHRQGHLGHLDDRDAVLVGQQDQVDASPVDIARKTGPRRRNPPAGPSTAKPVPLRPSAGFAEPPARLSFIGGRRR